MIRAETGLTKETASFSAAVIDILSPRVLPLLKPRECPEAWPPDVPEVETPPTQADRPEEMNGCTGTRRYTASPSLFSMWQSPIPSRWMAHLR